MRKVIITAVMILAIMAIALPAASPGGGEAGKCRDKYAIVFKNTGNPYGDKQMGGFKAGIEEQGFEAILRAPDQPTAEAQIQITRAADLTESGGNLHRRKRQGRSAAGSQQRPRTRGSRCSPSTPASTRPAA